jgi:hypothetical protein
MDGEQGLFISKLSNLNFRIKNSYTSGISRKTNCPESFPKTFCGNMTI